MNDYTTPGPWTFRAQPKDTEGANGWRFDHWVDGPTGEPICDVRDLGIGQGNARLIAAAPDLLHALRLLMMEDPEEGWPSGHRKEAFAAAVLACQKATGRNERTGAKL